MDKCQIKEGCRRVVRVLAFGLVLALMLQALSWVLVPKTYGKGGGMRNYRSRGFYGEEKDSLDVAAIGNSDLYSGFSPMEIWEDHGITAYACGEIKQQVNQAFYLLQELLTCQKPKVVILEVDSLFDESATGHLASILESAVKYVFPLLEYHDRWKEVKISDFKSQDTIWHDPDKGYYYSAETVPYRGGDYMRDKGKTAEMDPMTAYYLDEFMGLCRDSDIAVILVEMPSANSWNRARHEAVAAYAQQQEVPFIDFNLNMEETGFDWAPDSRDGGNHLNHSGARKISAWLGDYLAQNYELEDHRQDPAYSQWEQDLAEYKKNTG